MDIKRVFLIILDSFGIGEAPDAADFGDRGTDTLRTVSGSPEFYVPNMQKLGLFNIEGVCMGEKCGSPSGAFARLREYSRGKDTTVGHWELAGYISKKPLPTYSNGFPDELISRFERETGRGVLCNKPYSGTQVLLDFGREQIETGKLIVYTSADSVFQIAAHEKYIGLDELYRCCRIAREMLVGEHGVGRVIARAYIGEYPDFIRTANRHDYSLPAPRNTMPNILKNAGFDCIGVGKINDIFAGVGITESYPTTDNSDGMDKIIALARRDFRGLCFINLVEFDSKYGHRNDIDGYAAALADFDRRLGELLLLLRADDLLIITADHGCDPGTQSTDHSREYVPMLAAGETVRPGVNLGTRAFADVGASILDIFSVNAETDGLSFAKEIIF